MSLFVVCRDSESSSSSSSSSDCCSCCLSIHSFFIADNTSGVVDKITGSHMHVNKARGVKAKAENAKVIFSSTV